MKKKVFNLQTLPSSTRGPQVTRLLSIQSTGNFSFNRKQVEDLDLLNNGINFIQDEDRPKDWYIELTKDENALKVRASKDNRDFKLQSTPLSRIILESLKLTTSHRFIVANEETEEGSKMYAILSKSASPISKTPKEK